MTAEEVRPGYRRALVGQHVLFVRVMADSIEVVRILHQRQDPGIVP